MTINLLPKEIVNQIAAGEVIENPAAVIKELVENSIDSKADEIEIEIKNSGLDEIIIRDNGCGIEKDDLLKAPLRHATSKIKTFDDLYDIKTMGFRGEALASIFSIAKTKIISQTKESNDGFEISSDNITKIKKSASQKGTTIIVKDIFYNTPARKKYLKSENIELRNIIDVINRFIVYHHDKRLVLKHNNKNIINKPKFKTQIDNIYYTFGKDLKDNILYFENKLDGIKISGFLGKPSNITYSYIKNQYIFVNSRYIKSKIIRDAIYEGFGTNLMIGRHPFFVLFIEIDPQIIDVNIHPTKIEIKFENELEIFEFVKKGINEAFQKEANYKEFEENKSYNTKLNEHIDIIQNNTPKTQKEEKTYFTKDNQKTLELHEDVIDYNSDFMGTKIPQSIHVQTSKDYNTKENFESQTIADIKEEKNYGPLFEILKEYKIIGQINKTYIILETKEEMFMIDQHAAEEKCFFEDFLSQFESKNPKTQKLLKSEIINLPLQEMITFKENNEIFKKLGFIVEEFGSNQIIVRGVPFGIRGTIFEPNIIKDILGEISLDKKIKSFEIDKIEKLASKSCRRSIKAGYEMTTIEIKNLIERLKLLKEPFNCPHGRPVILRWSWQDLEKKFKRIV